MSVATINSYVQGNRVTVTATTRLTADDSLATPSTWILNVRNLADSTLLTFAYDGAVDTLPTGVNGVMTVVSEGIITFAFDVDEYGERRLYFAGTGACKCAGKGRFVVEKGDV